MAKPNPNQVAAAKMLIAAGHGDHRDHETVRKGQGDCNKQDKK